MSEQEATIFAPGGRVPPGTKLNGVYEIETSLAPGGMGEVYKGHEIFSGKKVAVKFIRRELEENPDARQLFMNEGNSLGEVHHDAVVRCFPLSIDPGLRRLYLPMEFVEGLSLFDLMQAGPLDVAQARLLLKRIAAGLQAAHDRSIFHRDVSPDNIMVPNNDCARAKIIDFGIARAPEASARTVIGSGFAGKHNYVSPEQCGLFGGDVRAQSDIYSLGLVIAGALLGRPLDMGGTLAQVMQKRHSVPDLAGIDPSIRPVLEAMLQPDPARRPASMQAVIDRISGTVLAPKTEITKEARPKRLWLAAVAAAVVIAAAGLAVFWPTLRALMTPAPVASPEERMQRFIATYAADPCFLVVPAKLTATSAELGGFGQDPGAAADGFAKAFTGEFGFGPSFVATTPATPPQCPALTSIQRAAVLAGAPPPTLTVISPAPPKSTLKSGRILSGAVSAASGSAVSLLRIDENGTVQDLSDELKQAEGEWTFQARVDRVPGAAEGAQPQLLVAVARPESFSLPSLPSDAKTFFTELDGKGIGAKLGLSASVFRLQN